jgi:hypothetical protein
MPAGAAPANSERRGPIDCEDEVRRGPLCIIADCGNREYRGYEFLLICEGSFVILPARLRVFPHGPCGGPAVRSWAACPARA